MSSYPGLFFVFKEKKASLSSLIVVGTAGIVVSILFKKVSKAVDVVEIFLVDSRPTFVKNLLNSCQFGMPISLVFYSKFGRLARP